MPKPPKSDPLETSARKLLTMHGGCCSVLEFSMWHAAFDRIAATDELTIKQSSTPGMVDVYAKDFQPRFDNAAN